MRCDALSLATGAAAACLDWNNNYGDDPEKCILFHCGPVPQSMMREKGRIEDHAILATAMGHGCSFGCNVGRMKPSPMTYGSVMSQDGRLRMYVGEGEFTGDSIPKEFFGTAGVAKIENLQDVLLMIGREGFRHHVAVSNGSVREPLAEAHGKVSRLRIDPPMNGQTELISQLDSRNVEERLAALESLCELKRQGRLDASIEAGPALPSYDHVHTTVSYGFATPGVYSVSRMVWAAHEADAYSTLIVEHESVAHCEEARRAAAIVNRAGESPLRLILGIEFKSPIVVADGESRRFSESIARTWGQGEAAWVVGIGVTTPHEELIRLAAQFQEAKRGRAQQQLQKLNRHLGLAPPLSLSQLLTPEGNVTDRSLCAVVAGAMAQRGLRHTGKTPDRRARMLNPGSAGYAPYPPGLPSYQEMIGRLGRLGMVPTFTAQLRGQLLADTMPLLKSWGIGGLDVAGIEPDNPNAERDIRQYIELAEQHGLAMFGGFDYRGAGTGWPRHAAWMDCPLIRRTIDRLAQPLNVP